MPWRSESRDRRIHTNKEGGSEGRFKTAAEPPGMPNAPVVIEKTETSVTLRLAPPHDDGGAPVTEYTVQMGPGVDLLAKQPARGFSDEDFVQIYSGYVVEAN